jgi:60 kDa SS-A/Ro ribonucleoprotein
MKYSNHLNQNSVTQTEQLTPSQVANNAGGYVSAIDMWTRLNRFLILGNEGGTFYQGEKALTKENAVNVIQCIKQDGSRVVDVILDVSLKGRAAKNDAAIFALALVCAHGDLKARQKAHGAIAKVCRTGTHLFDFCQAIKDLGGFGRGVKRGVNAYYLNKSEQDLANQILKYRQRNGWTHRDVLRLTHAKSENLVINEILNFAATVKEKLSQKTFENRVLSTFLALHSEPDVVKAEALAISAIQELRFTWEMMPNEVLSSKKVWSALVVDMPLMALVRNLGKLSTLELLTEFSEVEKIVLQKIKDKENLKKSRLHPIAILLALKTYASGQGFRGSNCWKVNQRVVAALNEAFYAAFGNVESTGKNVMLALDVSGSMTSARINNTNLTAREASAAMAMLALRTEDNAIIKGFSSNFMDLKINAKQSLEDMIKYMDRLPFDGTDCSLPMEWALKNKVKVDAFVVYTDNETYEGTRHPSVALQEYRKKVNPEAKLIVVGLTATEFSIADQNDKGMLDVVGFDTATPNIIREFILGKI